MRILAVTDRLDGRGGASRYWLDLMVWLAREHELRVAAGEGSVARLGADWPGRVGLTRVRALAAAGAVEADLQALAPLLGWADVVLVQNVMNPAALAQITATGRAVVTVQDHRLFCPGPGRTLPSGVRCTTAFEAADCALCLPDAEYRERMRGVTAARRDAVVGARLTVLSRYMAEELALVGLPGAEVLPPWVEVGPPRDHAGEGGLLAGRLVAHKGVQWAAQAWNQSGVAAPLRVAGAGAHASIFDKRNLNGWLNPEDLRALMRASRVLLFPARWQEPFGIAGLEALSVGLPVIAMDVGGVSDWAGPGAVRVPPGDVGAMAEAIAALNADPDAALALGEAGRRRVTLDFAPPTIQARWRALLAGG